MIETILKGTVLLIGGIAAWAYKSMVAKRAVEFENLERELKRATAAREIAADVRRLPSGAARAELDKQWSRPE